MVSICAVPYHVWTHALWSHLSQVLNVFMSKFPDICIIPYLSLFPEINFVWKATFTKKILSLESIISQEVTIPGKSDIPGSHISWEVTFPGKSNFPESQVTFPIKLHFPGIHTSPNFPGGNTSPRKSHFPGSHISPERQISLPGSHFSRKSNFSGKSNFPGSHKVPLVQPKIGIICQNLTIGGGGEEEKRLVDLQRLSLMASPQVIRTIRAIHI